MSEITQEDLMGLVVKTLEFPASKICKHYVCLDLLSLLESKGFKLDVELVKAISDADDEKAMELLKK